MNQKRKLGALGEELVVRFLVKHGFLILARNFLRKWGELDIVAKRADIIHFVEVKSVSHEIISPIVGNSMRSKKDVTRETSPRTNLGDCDKYCAKDFYRPEDNIHPQKVARLRRIIQTFLLGHHVSDETPWQFDIATVFLDKKLKKARVNFIEDIIL